MEHLLDEKSILSVTKRCEETIDIFADLSKDDMVEKIRHPETNSLKYMGVYCWTQMKLIVNLLLSDQVYNRDKNLKDGRSRERWWEMP